MNTKHRMLHFFHERTYEAQGLEEFEEEVKKAAAAGATHVYLMDVPKNQQEWTCQNGDPYPNWGMLQTSLFKIVVPKALEKYMDVAYAQRNFALLKQRGEIVKKYGLKSAMLVIDPFYFPEAAYLEHPHWRGPRCDHPRRSKNMYFAPCIDNPEVRTMYFEAMDAILQEMDLEYLQIITNDSGAGICWSTGSYNGKNGPAACKSIPLADRVLTFLDVFTDAAHKNQKELLVDMTSDIFGFKEHEAALDAAWPKLKANQLANGIDKNGQHPVYHIHYGLAEHVRPIKGLPLTVDFLKKLRDSEEQNSGYVKIIINLSEFDEYLRILKKYNGAKGVTDLFVILRSVAADIVGEASADALTDAWVELDEAVKILASLQLDQFVMMPFLAQRLINRPLVPNPALLTQDETAYYRPYLFQATSEEKAQDLMDIQGMDFIRGFGATRIATLCLNKVLEHLEKVVLLLNGLSQGEHGDKFALLAVRVEVLSCLLKTFRHAAGYQEVLDRTNRDEKPEFATRWPTYADERILKLNELSRAEIDNTYRLTALLNNRVSDIFTITEHEEDIFLISEELPKQLEKKARIMLAHIRDADAVYESNNF